MTMGTRSMVDYDYYQSMTMGTRSMVDYAGDKLTLVTGITSPGGGVIIKSIVPALTSASI